MGGDDSQKVCPGGEFAPLRGAANLTVHNRINTLTENSAEGSRWYGQIKSSSPALLQQCQSPMASALDSSTPTPVNCASGTPMVRTCQRISTIISPERPR